MIMFMAVMVVMRGSIKAADVQQLPCIRHLTEVPVNRGFADRGILFRYILVDLFSRCMYVKLPHGVANQLPLDGISFAVHALKIPCQQPLEGHPVARLVLAHFMYGVMDGVKVELFCFRSKIFFALRRAVFRHNSHLKVFLS